MCAVFFCCLFVCVFPRGADEYLGSVSIVEHKEKLHRTAVQGLKAALDTLKECAVKFTELSCREQAIEAHHKQAQCLRSVGHRQVCAMCYFVLQNSNIASLNVLKCVTNLQLCIKHKDIWEQNKSLKK